MGKTNRYNTEMERCPNCWKDSFVDFDHDYCPFCGLDSKGHQSPDIEVEDDYSYIGDNEDK